jgi:hypothetical protein
VRRGPTRAITTLRHPIPVRAMQLADPTRALTPVSNVPQPSPRPAALILRHRHAAVIPGAGRVGRRGVRQSAKTTPAARAAMTALGPPHPRGHIPHGPLPLRLPNGRWRQAAWRTTIGTSSEAILIGDYCGGWLGKTRYLGKLHPHTFRHALPVVSASPDGRPRGILNNRESGAGSHIGGREPPKRPGVMLCAGPNRQAPSCACVRAMSAAASRGELG